MATLFECPGPLTVNGASQEGSAIKSRASCAVSAENAHPRTFPEAVGTTRHTPPSARSSARRRYVRSHAARTMPAGNECTGMDATTRVSGHAARRRSARYWWRVAVSRWFARSSARRSAWSARGEARKASSSSGSSRSSGGAYCAHAALEAREGARGAEHGRAVDVRRARARRDGLEAHLAVLLVGVAALEHSSFFFGAPLCAQNNGGVGRGPFSKKKRGAKREKG